MHPNSTATATRTTNTATAAAPGTGICLLLQLLLQLLLIHIVLLLLTAGTLRCLLLLRLLVRRLRLLYIVQLWRYKWSKNWYIWLNKWHLRGLFESCYWFVFFFFSSLKSWWSEWKVSLFSFWKSWWSEWKERLRIRCFSADREALSNESRLPGRTP